MNNWFTVESIDESTFAISEYKHWEETHCYLLLGKEQAVLIDTGLGVSNIKVIADALTSLPVAVLTTHVHWDHIGGHRYFENIAVHEAETEWITEKFPLELQAVKENLVLIPCDFPAEFRLDDYRIYKGKPTRILHDGDIINLGNRSLEVIHTPGHSPGHCCFWEKDKGYLYSGDLIYCGCLDAFYPTTDPIVFMNSVDKIGRLKVKRLLPAHHTLDISPDMVCKTADAFHSLHRQGKLKQGSGIFDFGVFQIRV